MGDPTILNKGHIEGGYDTVLTGIDKKSIDIGAFMELHKTRISSLLDIAQFTCNLPISPVHTVGGTKTSQFYEKKFSENQSNGMSCPLDIYDCNLEIIQSKKCIQLFIDELCRELNWEQIGATYIKYFDNQDPGITFKQRTDQGIVSAHFKDKTIGACFDIHSRKYFDPNIIAEYVRMFFQGGKTVLDVSYREPSLVGDDQNEIKTVGGNKDIEYYKSEYENKNLWGISSAIDIHGCDIIEIAGKNNMTVEAYIKKFVADLCQAIKMVTDGDTQVDEVDHHGEKGIEFSQVITTSLISGHFREKNQTAYIEIFSCDFYDPNFVAQFVKDYFAGGATKIYVSYRGTK